MNTRLAVETTRLGSIPAWSSHDLRPWEAPGMAQTATCLPRTRGFVSSCRHLRKYVLLFCLSTCQIHRLKKLNDKAFSNSAFPLDDLFVRQFWRLCVSVWPAAPLVSTRPAVSWVSSQPAAQGEGCGLCGCPISLNHLLGPQSPHFLIIIMTMLFF